MKTIRVENRKPNTDISDGCGVWIEWKWVRKIQGGIFKTFKAPLRSFLAGYKADQIIVEAIYDLKKKQIH